MNKVWKYLSSVNNVEKVGKYLAFLSFVAFIVSVSSYIPLAIFLSVACMAIGGLMAYDSEEIALWSNKKLNG